MNQPEVGPSRARPFTKEQRIQLSIDSGLSLSYESRIDTMYAVRLSQCRLHRSFTTVQNREDLYWIKCRHPSCGFYIKYTKSSQNEHLDAGVWIHSCSVNDHILNKYRSPASDFNFLAKYLLPHVRNGITSQTKLQQILVTELGCNVPLSVVNRGLASAFSTLQYNEEKGYNLLVNYCEKVTNNGGYSHIDTVLFQSEDSTEIPPTEGEELRRFVRIFISLKEQINVRKFARFAALDAAHLSGKYKGVIMCATTQDMSGEIFILAHALVPSEDERNWNYFLSHFKLAFDGVLDFVISDRDKGLSKAFKEIFVNIPHSKCLRHLSENFKKKFGQEKTDILKHMAASYSNADMLMYQELLYNGNDTHDIINWIERADPKTWCRSMFPCPRFGIITSNPVEILFSAIREKRHLPALDLIVFLETYLLSKRFEKSEKAEKMNGPVVDRAAKEIEQLSLQAVYLCYIRTGNNTAVVTNTASNTRFSVNVELKTCTCGYFQERLIPCVHAIKFLTQTGRDPRLFCDNSYRVDYLRAMYAEVENPSGGTVIADLVVTQPLIPPVVQVLRGRKRKLRIESQSVAASNTSNTRKTRTVICPLCNVQGHTRATCVRRNVEAAIQ
jgi:hypothetical protein